MVVMDCRLVGSPLRYYWDPPPAEHYYYLTDCRGSSSSSSMDEETASTQSDSDTSVSSYTSHPSPKKETTSIRCGWRTCGAMFPTLDQLAAHVGKEHAASGPGGLFYCGWEGCTRNDRGFNARYKMLVHVRTHTNEKPHQCYQCDKSFSRAENLKIHTRSHSGEKPYVCPVQGCGKAYSNSSDRFKHTRTHQVDKPYQCKVPGCPKRYTDPSSLRKHVKTYKHCITEQMQQQPTSVPASCSCDRGCCVANCFSLLKLGAYSNYLKQSEMFIDPKRLFVPYEYDRPLDLSVRNN